MTADESTAAPKLSSLFAYSLLALPLAFAGLPLYVHAPDFYARDLGMSVGLIGAILLAVRLFDAFQDPVIGYLSDKYAAVRYKIVALGAGMLVAGMAAVFYGPPAFVPIALWFTAAMIIATTGFSVVTINLNMIGGFWHDDPQQRTRISAWREAFALAGLLVASVLPAALQHIKPAEDAFRIVFWVFAGLMLAAFIMFTRFMARITPGHKMNKGDPKRGLSFLKILAGPDKMFFAVCFLTHLAAALPGVMVLFFIHDYLGADNLDGVFLLLYFLSGAALIVFWVKLAARIGKYKAWLLSMLLAVFTFIWAFTLQPGDFIAYGIICVLSGLALGADLALPPSIVADRVNAQKTEGEATQYYALLAFIPKTAIAIASGISLLILDYLGFVPGQSNSDQVMSGVITLYALVPCVVKLGAAGLLLALLYKEDQKHGFTTNKRSASHGGYDIS